MHYEDIQAGIFLLEYKVGQRYPDILKMPYHVAEKQLKFFEKFQKGIGEALQQVTNNIG